MTGISDRHCTNRSGRRPRRGRCARSRPGRRASAGRGGAGGVPDLGQVPQRAARVMPGRLEPVITGSRWRSGPARHARSRCPGTPVASRQDPYPPGGPARPPRAKANPGPSRLVAPGGSGGSGGRGLPAPGRGCPPGCFCWFLGAGRAQPCPMAWPCWSVTVRHQVVCGVGGGGAGQVPGQPRVDRAQPRDLPRPVRQPQQGHQRDGQVQPPREPRRPHPGPRRGHGGGRIRRARGP